MWEEWELRCYDHLPPHFNNLRLKQQIHVGIDEMYEKLKNLVVWVVSLVRSEIKVFALNLQTGCSRCNLQMVCMNVFK